MLHFIFCTGVSIGQLCAHAIQRSVSSSAYFRGYGCETRRTLYQLRDSRDAEPEVLGAGDRSELAFAGGLGLEVVDLGDNRGPRGRSGFLDDGVLFIILWRYLE